MSFGLILMIGYSRPLWITIRDGKEDSALPVNRFRNGRADYY